MKLKHSSCLQGICSLGAHDAAQLFSPVPFSKSFPVYGGALVIVWCGLDNKIELLVSGTHFCPFPKEPLLQEEQKGKTPIVFCLMLIAHTDMLCHKKPFGFKWLRHLIPIITFSPATWRQRKSRCVYVLRSFVRGSKCQVISPLGSVQLRNPVGSTNCTMRRKLWQWLQAEAGVDKGKPWGIPEQWLIFCNNWQRELYTGTSWVKTIWWKWREQRKEISKMETVPCMSKR